MLIPHHPDGYRGEEVVFSSTGDRTTQQGDAPRLEALNQKNGILEPPHRKLLPDQPVALATRVPSSEPRHPFASVLHAAAGSLYAALFPSECRLCGIPLIAATTMPICEECIAAIVPLDIPRCSVCGEALVVGYRTQLSQARCNDCSREAPLFARAVAYGAYEGGLRELVHMLKYRHIQSAGDVLGRMLAETIAPLHAEIGKELQQDILVIPVPLHVSKFRQRGFNQSEVLASAALKQLRRQECPVRYQLEAAALMRRRATESQVGMTREQRQANMRGAFAVASKERIAGRCVLLVDDVFTTGTTVGECARVLLKAGAQSVWVATVARALKSTDSFESHLYEKEDEAQALAAHAT